MGATAGELPDGYHHLRWEEPIGTGEAAFRRAAASVMTWGMHRAVVRVVSAPPRAAVGEIVRMRYLGQSFSCMVVEVEETQDRVGFAYGTLPGHPERGEERFVVTRAPATGEVRLEVTAFSVPGTWMTRRSVPWVASSSATPPTATSRPSARLPPTNDEGLRSSGRPGSLVLRRRATVRPGSRAGRAGS